MKFGLRLNAFENQLQPPSDIVSHCGKTADGCRFETGPNSEPSFHSLVFD